MAYEIRIVCDKCGSGFKWTNESVSKVWAVKLARERGWSVGKQYLCPHCRRLPRDK